MYNNCYQNQEEIMNNNNSSSSSTSTSSVSYLIQNEQLPNDSTSSQRLIPKDDEQSRMLRKLMMSNVSIVALNDPNDPLMSVMSVKERDLIINHTLNNLDTIQRKLAMSELRYNQPAKMQQQHQQSSSSDIFNMTKITYKSKLLMPLTLLMLSFTLMPIQYHGENFGLQMKCMIDACLDAHGYFSEHQPNVLDTIFPYGFSSSLSFDYLSYELRALSEISQKYSSPNLTIKYLTQSDCVSNNFSKVLNIITIKTPAAALMTTTQMIHTTMNPYHLFTNYHFNHIDFGKLSRQFVANPEYKYNYHYQQQKLKSSGRNRQASVEPAAPAANHFINILIICDDEAYRRSMANGAGGSTVIPLVSLNAASTPPTTTTTTTMSSSEFESSYLPAVDTFDFQTNILSQWNISCKNLSSSTVTISYAQMTFLSGEIIGSIFFSMLADYIGRKRIYLATLYVSTFIGALVSMVQSYKQFVIIRFPIAALAQVCSFFSPFFFKLSFHLIEIKKILNQIKKRVATLFPMFCCSK